MELSQNYLTLKLRRLKGTEVMETNGGGLLFVLVKSGAGVCQGGASPHRLGAGDALAVDSSSARKIQARGGDELVFWHFVAEFEHLFPLFSGREICWLQNVLEGFKTARVYPGSSPLAKECLRLVEEVPAQFNLDHRSHVLRIVSAVLTAEFKAMQPKMADFVPARDHVFQVFERLQTSEILSLSVGELAKKFSCSRRHLNRLFHQHFGLSVAALRMEMRLLKAVSLLVNPDAKVLHVAEKCGFNHLGLFNTCFKKRFGSSPSQWRKTFNHASHLPPERAGIVCLSPNQGLGIEAAGARGNRMGNGQTRRLENAALGGLLKDIETAKNQFRLVPSVGGKTEVRASV